MYGKPMPRIKERPLFCYELLDDYGGPVENLPKNITDCKNIFMDKDGPTFKISSSIYQELKK